MNLPVVLKMREGKIMTEKRNGKIVVRRDGGCGRKKSQRKIIDREREGTKISECG